MSDIPYPPPPVPDGPMAPISPGGPDAPGGYGPPGGHGGGKSAGRTMPVFKRLLRDRIETIPHGHNGFPVVDVYELAWFQAVLSADEMSGADKVQFYVYHSSDGIARSRTPDGHVERVAVDHSADPWHIPFEQALCMWGVDYNDDRHLGDVVVDFWSALFSAPSDPFDETTFGVSPWMERNVGDRRTVGSMRPGTAGGEWDNLRLRFRPRKTLNWPAPSAATAGGEPGLLTLLNAAHLWLVDRKELEAQRMAFELREKMMAQGGSAGGGATGGGPVGAPPCVEVLQLDLNTVGLRLLQGGPPELAVMVLLH